MNTLRATTLPRQGAENPTYVQRGRRNLCKFLDHCQEQALLRTDRTACPSGYLYRALLFDDDAAHAERLIARILQPQRLAVEHVRSLDEAVARIQRRTNCYELVIVNVSANGPPWQRTLRKLQQACQRLNGQAAPLFLCLSNTRKAPDFILQTERLGARYVFER